MKLGKRTAWVLLFFLFGIMGSAIFVGCDPSPESTEGAASSEEGEERNEVKKVEIVYVDWESEIASSHVVQAVIEEKLGYQCELLEVSATAMWEAIAAGDKDAMVAAWLPELQQEYYEKHQDDLVDLGPNLEGAETGLVVPEYLQVDSIEELKEYAEELDHKIIGIDPEAGIMSTTEKVMDEYSLDEFELITGSDYTMTSALESAVEDEEWIVVTGWSPHWKFARWDLKYLDDPREGYGEEEYISSMVRENLEEDMPEVYTFLNNFYWYPEDMGEVMLWIQEEDLSPEEAASQWIKENQDTVEEWLQD